MSQAEELLDSLSTDDVSLYTAKPEVEEHIVVGNDRYIKVPGALKRIAVQHDHNVETVTFDCPRYWDDTDLSTLYIWINYIRKDRVTGRYLAKNKRVDENDSNMIHFDWTIGNEITEVDGPIVFLVCALKTNSEGMEEVHWNSEKCTDCFVSPGMECADTTMNEYPDIITDLLARMDTIITANGTIIDTSLTQAGLAADARATGEAINKVDNRVTEIIEGTDFTEVVGNPIHLKEASRNNANLTPMGVTEQTVIEGEAGVSVVGESIHVTDVDATKEASLFAGANTTQETRKGYNLLQINETNWQLTDKGIKNLAKNEGVLLTKEGINFKANTTYYLNFVLLSRPTSDTSFAGYIDGVSVSSLDFANIMKDTYQIGKVVTKTYTPTKDEVFSVKMWGNSDSGTFEFQYWVTTDSTKTTYEQFGVMPSIDFPSEIKSVGGGSVNKLNVKNLLSAASSVGITVDENDYVTGGSIDSREYTYANTNWKETLKAGTYSVIIERIQASSSQYSGLCVMLSDSTGLITLNGEAINNNEIIVKQFTLTEDSSIGVLLKTHTGIFRVRILKGTYTNDTVPDYLPYGYSRYTFDVVNKNLIPNSETEYTAQGVTTIKANNKFTLNGTTTTTWVDMHAQEKMFIPKGSKITFSRNRNEHNLYLRLQFSDGTYHQFPIDSGKYSATYTLPKDVVEYRIFIQGFTAGEVFNNYELYVQLEIGETATSSVIRLSQSLNLDIPEGIELNKLGDVSDKIDFTFTMDETGYKTIDRDSVKHVGNVDRYILTEDENINGSVVEGYTRFFVSIPNMKNDGLDGRHVDIKCNYFKTSVNNNYEICFRYKDQIFFYSNESISTVEDFIAFAKDKLEVLYITATLIETPITDETFISQLEALINIKPYEGVTNVFVTASDDGSCLPLTEFLYNYITAAPSVKRPTPVLGISGSSKMYHTGKNVYKPSLTTDDGYVINQTRSTVTINEDEFIFNATGADMYFGEIVQWNSPYGAIRANGAYPGELYKAKPKTCLVISSTNPDVNRLYVTTYDKNKISQGFRLLPFGIPFEMPVDAEYYSLRFGKIDSVAGKTYKTKIQIETLESTADTPSDYQEPQNETIKLTLPEGMELFEGESIYKEEGKWYRDKDYHREEITEDYTIYLANSSEGIYQFEFQPKYTPEYNNNDSTIRTRSNLFLGVPWTNSWNIDNTVVSKSDGRIRFMSSKYTTVEEFKSFINKQIELNDPLYVVYKLANPGPEEITDATLLDQLNTLSKLKTYKGVNNFFLTSAGADGLMKLEYRKFNLVGHEDIAKFEEELDSIRTEINEDVNKDIEDINGRIDDIVIPTNVSELENDAGYVTSSTLFTTFVSTKHLCLESTIIGANATKSSTVTFTKDGYYPIALAGFNVTGATLQDIYISSASKGSASVHFTLKNSDPQANTTGALSCWILWAK